MVSVGWETACSLELRRSTCTVFFFLFYFCTHSVCCRDRSRPFSCADQTYSSWTDSENWLKGGWWECTWSVDGGDKDNWFPHALFVSLWPHKTEWGGVTKRARPIFLMSLIFPIGLFFSIYFFCLNLNSNGYKVDSLVKIVCSFEIYVSSR